MKSKAYITKAIALVLCIITITLSVNIYLSYNDLYHSDNLLRNSIIYTAQAKTSLKDYSVSINGATMPSIKIEEINNNKSLITPSKEDVQKNIFIKILILFLSFITLASVHNLIINEEYRKYNSKSTDDLSKNININRKISSSLVSKEGA